MSIVGLSATGAYTGLLMRAATLPLMLVLVAGCMSETALKCADGSVPAAQIAACEDHLQDSSATRLQKAVAHFRIAKHQARLGKKAEALTRYGEAIRLHPEYAAAYNNRANLYTDLGQFDQALADYETALSLRPDAADYHYNRSTLHFLKGDLVSAVGDLDQALDLDPTRSDFLFDRGALLSKLGKHIDARRDYDKVIAAIPSHLKSLENRALGYVAENDLEAARRDFSAAIKLQPEDGRLYNWRAHTSCSLGDYDASADDRMLAVIFEAIAIYELVAVINEEISSPIPSFAPPHSALLDALGEWTRAGCPGEFALFS